MSAKFVSSDGGVDDGEEANEKKAHLNIGKAYDAPEIIENRDLRYGRRVET